MYRDIETTQNRVKGCRHMAIRDMTFSIHVVYAHPAWDFVFLKGGFLAYGMIAAEG